MDGFMKGGRTLRYLIIRNEVLMRLEGNRIVHREENILWKQRS